MRALLALFALLLLGYVTSSYGAKSVPALSATVLPRFEAMVEAIDASH